MDCDTPSMAGTSLALARECWDKLAQLSAPKGPTGEVLRQLFKVLCFQAEAVSMFAIEWVGSIQVFVNICMRDLYYCKMRERAGAKNKRVDEQSACLRAARLTETDASVVDGAVVGEL